MSDQNEKEGINFSAKQASEFVQSGVQSVLFECPKCECPQTAIIGKKSYFGAWGSIILGILLAFLTPAILAIKVFIYIVTFKFDRIRKMAIRQLWDGYIISIKSWLIVLTFGIANLTKKYKCEKCGQKWIV